MIVPTREFVEAQEGANGTHGIWYRSFYWPIPLDDEEAYWSFKPKEPQIREEYHVDGKVIVFSIPTKEEWVQLPPGCPVIIRFKLNKDGLVCGGGPLTEQEVYAYREAMYGDKKKGPPKRRSA